MITIGTYEDPNYEIEMWPLIIDRIKHCKHVDGKMMIMKIDNKYKASTFLQFASAEPLMTKDELKENYLSPNYKLNRDFYECLKESGKNLKPDIKAVLTLIYAQALTTRTSINQMEELKRFNGRGMVLHIDKKCIKYEYLNVKYFPKNKVPKLVCDDCEIKPVCFYESIMHEEHIPHN